MANQIRHPIPSNKLEMKLQVATLTCLVDSGSGDCFVKYKIATLTLLCHKRNCNLVLMWVRMDSGSSQFPAVTPHASTTQRAALVVVVIVVVVTLHASTTHKAACTTTHGAALGALTKLLWFIDWWVNDVELFLFSANKEILLFSFWVVLQKVYAKPSPPSTQSEHIGIPISSP